MYNRKLLFVAKVFRATTFDPDLKKNLENSNSFFYVFSTLIYE